MGKPDALSQWADHGSGAEDNSDITLLTPNFFAVHALEGVEVEGEERDLLQLIHRETKEAELEDTVTQAAKKLKSSSAKSICSSEWSEVDGILHFHGKIYVPPLMSPWCLYSRRSRPIAEGEIVAPSIQPL